MSCMSRKCVSRSSCTRTSSEYTSGMASSSVVPGRSDALLMGSGVRMPATTSSPCASGSHSPKMPDAPVLGFLVNATPVPEVCPLLPKTMACTFTAVPVSSLMPWVLR